jgi:dihydrofolate reductase
LTCYQARLRGPYPTHEGIMRTMNQNNLRKLILQMQISIDGFVGGPNGELDWVFKSMDETLAAWGVEHLWMAGVHIMGSRTFQDMAAYWPTSNEPFAAPMNEIPKVVFTDKGFDKSKKNESTQGLKDAIRSREEKGLGTSSTPSRKSWEDATVIIGNLAEEITRLKQQPGKEILAHGGAGFASSLVKLGLIDEYRLITHPVALGKGLPLFSELAKPVELQLVNVTTFNSGAVAHIYKSVTGSLNTK